MFRSLPRIAFLMVLVHFLIAESPVQAQGPGSSQLRGAQKQASGTRAPTAALLPAFPPGLLNNGSLQTTQNPNANLPNQVRFSYTATLPLGDRLGLNGVYYDSNLLPNNGMFNGGINIFAQNQAAGINEQAVVVNGARMARTPFIPTLGSCPMGAYQSYFTEMMQPSTPAMVRRIFNGGPGWLDNGTFPNTMGGAGQGLVAPTNNQGFGAGSPNAASGPMPSSSHSQPGTSE